MNHRASRPGPKGGWYWFEGANLIGFQVKRLLRMEYRPELIPNELYVVRDDGTLARAELYTGLWTGPLPIRAPWMPAQTPREHLYRKVITHEYT